MLRRKLLVVLGSLVLLTLAAAVSAILLLHAVLEDLIHASTAVAEGAAECHQLEVTAARLELEVGAESPSLPSIQEQLTALADGTGRLQALLGLPPEALGAIRSSLPEMDEAAGELAVDAEPRARALERARGVASGLRERIAELSAASRDHSAREHQQLIRKFRAAGLAVGVVFLLLLNASIAVLLRAADMVLRPVARLVEASRRLGREEFSHRVDDPGKDEFAELAQAYNSLAGQLEANERRKVETLHQVARMLSHELNNAISAIDLQLTLLGRRTSDRSLAEPLRRIQEPLGRMSRIIDALTRVRRIVLTDYLSGIKMLDLERSVVDNDQAEQPDGNAVAGQDADERAQRAGTADLGAR
jgi:nitrate/nitrite-specific signal transduction histidine kinase